MEEFNKPKKKNHSQRNYKLPTRRKSLPKLMRLVVPLIFFTIVLLPGTYIRSSFASPIWLEQGAYAQYDGDRGTVEFNASIHGQTYQRATNGVTLRWEILEVNAPNATVRVTLNESTFLGTVHATVIIDVTTRNVYNETGNALLGTTWFWFTTPLDFSQTVTVTTLTQPSAALNSLPTQWRVNTPQGVQESIHLIIQDAFFFTDPAYEYGSRGLAGSWELDTGIFAQGAGDFLTPCLVPQGIVCISTTWWLNDTNIDFGPPITTWVLELYGAIGLVIGIVVFFIVLTVYLLIRERKKRKHRRMKKRRKRKC
jgi:hypothetical protein